MRHSSHGASGYGKYNEEMLVLRQFLDNSRAEALRSNLREELQGRFAPSVQKVLAQDPWVQREVARLETGHGRNVRLGIETFCFKI